MANLDSFAHGQKWLVAFLLRSAHGACKVQPHPPAPPKAPVCRTICDASPLWTPAQEVSVVCFRKPVDNAPRVLQNSPILELDGFC